MKFLFGYDNFITEQRVVTNNTKWIQVIDILQKFKKPEGLDKSECICKGASHPSYSVQYSKHGTVIKICKHKIGVFTKLKKINSDYKKKLTDLGPLNEPNFYTDLKELQVNYAIDKGNTEFFKKIFEIIEKPISKPIPKPPKKPEIKKPVPIETKTEPDIKPRNIVIPVEDPEPDPNEMEFDIKPESKVLKTGPKGKRAPRWIKIKGKKGLGPGGKFWMSPDDPEAKDADL